MTDDNNIEPHQSEAGPGHLGRLETPIHEAVRLTRIVSKLVDTTLSLDGARSIGPDMIVFTMTRDDLEDLAFAAHEAQHRVAAIFEAFEATVVAA